MKKSETSYLVGKKLKSNNNNYSENIDYSDHKIKFMLKFCEGKNVLDLGCVMHDPDNYQSKYWLHKAILSKAKKVLGVDLYEDGINFLLKKGFNVINANVESLNLEENFDVIVAGDIIEHINNFEGFFLSCAKHLKDDGVLLVSTPNPWHWRYIIRSISGGEIDIVNPEHSTWFCPKTLRQLAERFGFEQACLEYGSRYRRELIMPLPTGLKHQSFFMAFNKSGI